MPPVNGNGWRTMVPLVGLAIAGLIGWGALQNEAAGLRRDVDKKADAALVELQYQTLLREIQALRADLRKP